MPFTSARITRVGGRQHNEDYYGELRLGDAGCWVVADGLGGHRGGETASSLAVQAVLASFQSNPEFSTGALRQHLDAAQQAVLKVQEEESGLNGMRTTIVVLITGSKQALWAHVGDSRLYCFDAGRIAFHTKDHSVVQAMVNAGELSARDLRHHEDRNRLLRALGNPDGDFRPEIPAQGHTLYRGSAFLLCTDGFWENVWDGEMEIELAKAQDPDDWLAKMETRLLERIVERTAPESDNYSAIAIFFDSDSAPDAPAPNLMEDGEMNGNNPGLGTVLVLAGIMLVALAAAALGVGNWLAIRGLEQFETRAQVQPPPAPVTDLTPRVAALEKRLDGACKGDANLKVLCNPGALAALPAKTDPAPNTTNTQPLKEKKARKQKKAATNSDS